MSLSCLANVKRTEGVRPPVPPHVVYASYVGDRSGSMESQMKASAEGVYEWVKNMCSGVINNNQEGYISVTFFDNREEVRMDNISMNDVQISMSQARDWSCPRATTKLYDTAIASINKLRRRIKEHKERCPNLNIKGVFQLFSDGVDNESIASEDMLQAAIESAKKEGISCIYLGIGQNAIQIGQRYGFDAETSLSADIGELTSQIAFRGCSLNALRCASTGTTPAMPEMLRQRSAPTQCPQGYGQNVPAMNLKQSPCPPPSLHMGRCPPPSLRQPAVNY
tara:strand:+ start:1303 stop:2142 length:840 start_codon:yes stop_codon:yes gene_type:complete